MMRTELKTIQIGWAFILLGLLAGCGNAGYQKNRDGLVYIIFRTGKGEKLKKKTWLKIHQKVEIGDTVFVSTFNKVPAFGNFDSLAKPAHDFLDILDLMHYGDSAIVIRSIDTLVKRGMAEYNDKLKQGGVLKITVKPLKGYPDQATFEEDRLAEMENYKKIEITELEKFIKSKNIKNVEKKPEGVFVETLKQGTGMAADTGMKITMMYTGKLMDGTVFDSNIDSAFGHTDPFVFEIGTEQIIKS